MRFYNSATNTKEEFIPLVPNEVKMYACGPTVYNYFHIGNARPFIVFDLLRQYFLYRGYKVTFVQNFTDVDDKIIKKANEEGVSASEISERYISEYFTDAKGLNIQKADVHPKVSENIPEIIQTIETLIEKGFAYNVDGNVYYKVDAFADYGKLSKQPMEDLISGARIEVNDEKKSPIDFALWKKKKEGEIAWQSPWGEGRPGWHIECTAMSKKYLGETIDIHGGGQDLIFPHHENEIAQSEACSGKKFARYWLHNGYINIDNVKMSKSLGNFFTVREISEKFDLEVVRFFIISAHYRSPINFSAESLSHAQNGLERLYNVKNSLEFKIKNSTITEMSEDEQKFIISLDKFIQNFNDAMDDDINTANAITAIFEMAREINIHITDSLSVGAAKLALDKFLIPNTVLGLLNREEKMLDEDIQALIDARTVAKKSKDFKRADEIRDQLKDMGITLEDTRDGVKWKRD